MALPNIRLVRAAPDPLGLYLRIGHTGQKDLQSFISSGDAAFSGVVFDARRVAKQKELLSLVLERRIDAVLDPQTQPMALPGGYIEAMGDLPWSAKRVHTYDDFSPNLRHKIADEIAQFAVANGFTQVLAPTHLLTGPDDRWLDIDIATTKALRLALHRRGGKNIQINYSLAVSYVTFRTASKRKAILDRLRAANIDSVWLHVDGCGADSSPTAVTRYSDAAVDFHDLGLPIVADHMGGLVGLSLLAFGVVGGLSHGITLGERFNCGHWHKVPVPGGPAFAPKLRVYIPPLDLMLPRGDAERLFETGGKARTAFGCRNTACCARGITDMLQAPARHFLYQRTREIAGLSQIPESLRPQQFLEEHLRPASDRAILAKQLPLPETLQKKIDGHSKRLNDLRIVLGTYSQTRRQTSFAQHPKTRAAREVGRQA
ncbi:hypothetical protein ACFPOE_22265 [Caenimonas terrae]|uniref:Uncharacterized protein n=1 Tax=Caenimonas terrae TaxID=696074 RepID=A0ABW0NKM8_9BURK